MTVYRVYLEPVDVPYLDITATDTASAIRRAQELAVRAPAVTDLRAAVIEHLVSGMIVWAHPDRDHPVTD
jgi:hypothetical protein